MIPGNEDDSALCVLLNAGANEAAFEGSAPTGGGAWRIAIDTGAKAPRDIAGPGREMEMQGGAVRVVAPRGLTVLVGPAGVSAGRIT